MTAPLETLTQAQVHCPSCTHSVPADVLCAGKRVKVVTGQKCERCRSSLDAAAVLYLRQAA